MCLWFVAFFALGSMPPWKAKRLAASKSEERSEQQLDEVEICGAVICGKPGETTGAEASMKPLETTHSSLTCGYPRCGQIFAIPKEGLENTYAIYSDEAPHLWVWEREWERVRERESDSFSFSDLQSIWLARLPIRCLVVHDFGQGWNQELQTCCKPEDATALLEWI